MLVSIVFRNLNGIITPRVMNNIAKESLRSTSRTPRNRVSN